LALGADAAQRIAWNWPANPRNGFASASRRVARTADLIPRRGRGRNRPYLARQPYDLQPLTLAFIARFNTGRATPCRC
jgi:hypothetical protein